jgi:hypothetical protein
LDIIFLTFDIFLPHFVENPERPRNQASVLIFHGIEIRDQLVLSEIHPAAGDAVHELATTGFDRIQVAHG